MRPPLGFTLMSDNLSPPSRRFLPSAAGRRALKLYGFALLLALLGGIVYGQLADEGLVRCNGESCMLAAIAPVLFLLQWPGALLYRLVPHHYWDLANIPGFHLLQVPLCLAAVYYFGKGCAWLAKKRSASAKNPP